MGKAVDATGYPLTHTRVLRQDATPRTSGDLVSCPSRAVPLGAHGEPRTITVRISLTVHEKTSLLTVGYGPDLGKAVLRLVWQASQSSTRTQPLIPGSANSGLNVPVIMCKQRRTWPSSRFGELVTTQHGPDRWKKRVVTPPAQWLKDL
jgi:hypothetical protein